MLNQAKLSDKYRNGLWAECAKCATQSSIIIVKPGEALGKIGKQRGSLYIRKLPGRSWL
jgi:hypothetical protein